MFDIEKYCGKELLEDLKFYIDDNPDTLTMKESDVIFDFIKHEQPSINPAILDKLKVRYDIAKIRRGLQHVREGKGNYKQRLAYEKTLLIND